MTSAAETKTPSSSPVLVYVRELSQLEGRQFYVASQVATQLGISVQAVRKYTKNKVCGNGVVPTYKVKFSRNKDADNDKGIIINLYTDEDITLLRQFLDSRKVVYRADEEVSS